MMKKPKKQPSRGHISIPGDLYEEFRRYCDTKNTTMAACLEQSLDDMLDLAERQARLDA